jgi:hypothetical protein
VYLYPINDENKEFTEFRFFYLSKIGKSLHPKKRMLNTIYVKRNWKMRQHLAGNVRGMFRNSLTYPLQSPPGPGPMITSTSYAIKVYGHKVEVKRAAVGRRIAFFTFKDLCDVALGAADYEGSMPFLAHLLHVSTVFDPFSYMQSWHDCSRWFLSLIFHGFPWTIEMRFVVPLAASLD